MAPADDDAPRAAELLDDLRLARRELRWTQVRLEQSAEDLQRVRRQRARLRDVAEGLAEALAGQLAASYWTGQHAGRGPLRRRSEDPEAALVREIEASDLFDGGWYLRRHPAVVDRGVSPALDYARRGNRKDLDPGPRFSTRLYLDRHPEVRTSAVPALVHAHRHQTLADGSPDTARGEPPVGSADAPTL